MAGENSRHKPGADLRHFQILNHSIELCEVAKFLDFNSEGPPNGCGLVCVSNSEESG